MAVIINEFEIVLEEREAPNETDNETLRETEPPPQPSPQDIQDIINRFSERKLRLYAH